jgi:hypothetical protein
MNDEIAKTLASYLEPIGPCHQELYPIALGKSWGTIFFNVDDFSTKPVLFGHLKRLPADFDVKIVSVSCSEWNENVQNLDVLRAVINDNTYVWAEDDCYFESGEIEIVGNTETVKTIGAQICEDPQVYEMPAIKEIFPPIAEWPGWIEAKFGRGRLDLEKLRQSLLGLNELKASIFVPIEDFSDEALFRLFAVINGDTFLKVSMSSYQLVGPKATVNQVAMELKNQLGGKLFDWIRLDAEGKPTRLDLVGRV